jgi:hypothetical protein
MILFPVVKIDLPFKLIQILYLQNQKNNLPLNDLDFILLFYTSLNIPIPIQNSYNLTIIKSFLFSDFQYSKDIFELFKVLFTSKLIPTIFGNYFFFI